MSKRDNSFLIQDMLESANKILDYTTGLSFEQFEIDNKTIDAVIRNFEIIGEASNRIDGDFKVRNSQIEWAKMRGFRNRIVHDYFGIDLEIVWSIIQDDIEELIYQLKELHK
uniref:HepT-like ribonuclease domain-containing protein n=1 Tax=Roseivirga sp. TaxID=1964215 RepID=UPI004047490A